MVTPSLALAPLSGEICAIPKVGGVVSATLLTVTLTAAEVPVLPAASYALDVSACAPFAAVVVLAAPRALRAWQVMARPAPATAPAGYVGWPLWYHRVCLVHNRLFGWLMILAAAAITAFFIWLAVRQARS